MFERSIYLRYSRRGSQVIYFHLRSHSQGKQSPRALRRRAEARRENCRSRSRQAKRKSGRAWNSLFFDNVSIFISVHVPGDTVARTPPQAAQGSFRVPSRSSRLLAGGPATVLDDASRQHPIDSGSAPSQLRTLQPRVSQLSEPKKESGGDDGDENIGGRRGSYKYLAAQPLPPSTKHRPTQRWVPYLQTTGRLSLQSSKLKSERRSR